MKKVQKKIYFLHGKPFTPAPPPLNGTAIKKNMVLPLRKITFFAAALSYKGFRETYSYFVLKNDTEHTLSKLSNLLINDKIEMSEISFFTETSLKVGRKLEKLSKILNNQND